MIKNGFIKANGCHGVNWINIKYVKRFYVYEFDRVENFKIGIVLEKDAADLDKTFQSHEEAELYLEKIIYDAYL
ncbi:MAG: hypothetical protein ACYC0F_18470 [Rhodanobacter sp.]